MRQQLKEDSFIGNCTGSRLSLQRTVLFSMDSWRSQAACLGMTDLMYSDQHKRARAVCNSCEVQKECLSASMLYETMDVPWWGMIAGMTASERYRFRKRLMR